ncbi:hypothetical protein JCM16303_000805 [Sporobolomyces ruberrimus]
MRYSIESVPDSHAGLVEEEEGHGNREEEAETTGESETEGDDHALLPLSRKNKLNRYADVRTRQRGRRRSKGRNLVVDRHRLVSTSTGLLHLATLFLLCVVTLFGLATCGWVAWFMYTRHNAYAQSVFSPSLQPLPRPVESHVRPFVLDSSSNSTGDVQSELEKRLLSLSLPPSTLPCPDLSSLSHLDSNSTFATRYSDLPKAGPYLIALNLYNSQHVIPTLSRTLITLSDFLGRDNLLVSIFENGSRDNTTLALAHLAAALTSLKVGHTIVSDPRATDWSRVDRIDQLAIYRNVALAPVSRGLRGKEFDNVLFVNDVFIGPTDALELLWQRKEQEADAACAMDWRHTKGFTSRWGAGSVKFYDNWVTRSITGNMLRSRLDIFGEGRHGVKELFDPSVDQPSRERLKRGLPFPVYSCWDGMIAMNAEPFRTIDINPHVGNRTGPSGVSSSTLRASFKPTTFRTALNAAGECAASECKTIAKDFWSRGYNRWIIVPTVHVSYEESVYSHPHLIDIVTAARNFFASETTRTLSTLPPYLSPKINWSLPEWSAPSNVVCWSWARGFHIDIPGWRSTREKAWK